MLDFLKTYGLVILLSMMPISELRGAIPTGISLGLNPYIVWGLAVLGNLLPVPFIVLFIRRILEWMLRRKGFLGTISRKMYEKAEKGSRLYYKYELLGLMLLVAIPLPGTGAWTGALVAALMDMRLKNAFPTIVLGVLIASIITMIVTMGVAWTIS